LISSVLTTLAVFVPLVFLSGISGALFYDQAVSVAAILSVSLLVAFVLLPLLYKLLFSNRQGKPVSEDSRLFLSILAGYKRLYRLIFAHRAVSLVVLLALIPAMLFLSQLLPVQGLPPIQKFDALLQVDWNEPINASQNRERIARVVEALEGAYVHAESDIGIRQFLLFEGESSIQQASLYLMFPDQEQKERQEAFLSRYFKQHHPQATVAIQDAPNAFDQLFSSDLPYYEVRWKDLASKRPVEERQMDQWLDELSIQEWEPGPGLQKESAVIFRIDQERLALYGIAVDQLLQQIQKLFGSYLITDIKRFGEVTPIRLKENPVDFQQVLRTQYIRGNDDTPYLLSNFVRAAYDSHYKFVTADRNGIYQSVLLIGENPSEHEQVLRQWGGERNLSVEFVGQYFQDRETLSQLIGILLISVLLLYFILAAQFESFLQPLIVILTLPLGVGGAFLVLWITGTSLNVMSAIGLVVMLGIMVNDAILKIDTINRLRVQFVALPEFNTKQSLEKALYQAGEIRLKPILMTSITTILALIPVVFSSGLGADLQRPLVFSVIGGLTIGTFTALYFVPLMYWFLVARAK